MSELSGGVDDSERFNLPHVLAVLAAKEWEALELIKADVCQWLAKILQLPNISPSTFLDTLGTGVEVCRLASLIQKAASEAMWIGESFTFQVPMDTLSCNAKATPGSFHARDNTSNFISWCRNLGVEEAVIFESEGLVLGKDEKRVILCLLDVARFAERVGISPPQLVQMEREIEELERAIAEELRQKDSTSNSSLSILHSTPNMEHRQDTHETTNAKSSPISSPSAPPPLSAPPSPSALPPPLATPLSTKKFVSRIPVRRSSRHLAARRQEASTPQQWSVTRPRGSVTRPRGSVTRPRDSVTRPRKRARSEEEGESEEECHTPSRKRARVGRTGGRETKVKRRLKPMKGAEEKERKVSESLDVSVMKKMAECTCRNKIAVTNCGNGKFIVKGASGREMTTHARVSYQHTQR